MIKERRNYYRILQVQPDAPLKVIQASYRAMMKELHRHPDLGGSTEDAFILNEAYETLSNPQKRAVYDDMLFQRSIDGYGRLSEKKVVADRCPICGEAISRKLRPGDICQNCRTPLCSELDVIDEQDSRRSIARIKASGVISYNSRWPSPPRYGKIMDFSPRGMRFICTEALLPLTVLKLSSPLLDAAGVVTNLSEEAAAGEVAEQKAYAVGVRFLAVRFTDTRGTFLSTSA